MLTRDLFAVANLVVQRFTLFTRSKLATVLSDDVTADRVYSDLPLYQLRQCIYLAES